MRDLIHYVPKIKHGGIIAGHDYQSAFPGVTQAVDEFFKKLPLSQYQEKLKRELSSVIRLSRAYGDMLNMFNFICNNVFG